MTMINGMQTEPSSIPGAVGQSLPAYLELSMHGTGQSLPAYLELPAEPSSIPGAVSLSFRERSIPDTVGLGSVTTMINGLQQSSEPGRTKQGLSMHVMGQSLQYAWAARLSLPVCLEQSSCPPETGRDRCLGGLDSFRVSYRELRTIGRMGEGGRLVHSPECIITFGATAEGVILHSPPTAWPASPFITFQLQVHP